jgi:uncharacterized protein YndB with AHSA1/START domain
VGVPELVVEVERRIAAPPEEVFAFFTDPVRYVRWQGISAELDPTPGGLYRVQMTADSAVRGSYVEIDPPVRVVFTWGWEGNPELPPGSSTVEITLRADDAETVLHLRHSGLPDEQTAAMHDEGWQLFIGQLGVAAAATPSP